MAELPELETLGEIECPPGEPIEVTITNPTADTETVSICNGDTDTWWYTTFVDGVETASVDSGVPCDAPPPQDVEPVEECRGETIWNVWYATNPADNTMVEIGAADTGKPCVQDSITIDNECPESIPVKTCPDAPLDVNVVNPPVPDTEVDIELICDAGTVTIIETTSIDGVPGEPVITETDQPCGPEEKLDFEQTRRCVDETVHIVTVGFNEAGIEFEVSDVDTGESCDPLQPVTETVCVLAPAAPFEIDNGVTSDCDVNSGDFSPGDPWTFTWSPTATVDGQFCYPCATDNGDGSWSITGTVATVSGDLLGVDWGCSAVTDPINGDGVATLPGHFLYEGVCYPIPAELCSGGNESITATEHFSPLNVDKTHGPGFAAIYSDCITGEIIDGSEFIDCKEDGKGYNPNYSTADSCTDCGDGVAQVEDSQFKECVKWQTLAIGLDNTKTRFDWNSTIEILLSNGTTVSFVQPAQAGWTQQIELWAAELQALLPECVVEPRCNIDGGCGGLLGPVSDAPLPAMFARYVHISCCPTGVYPVGASIIEGDGAGRILVVESSITPIKKGYFCSTCDGGNGELKFDDGTPVPAADLPVCTFNCSEVIPDPVQPPCQFDTLAGNWCDLVESGDPEIEDEIEESEIVVLVTTCGADQVVEYFTVVDGALEAYTPVGIIVDCETGEEPFVAPPACPEGAVFNAVEIGGSYFILDNSRWTGLPVNHLQNGNNYEMTFTHVDGSTTVVQQTSDPYFNSFRNEIPAALTGCTVVPVCANHTAAAGCRESLVNNLAGYPAYDAPTFPADNNNTLSNPDQNELWATGWLIDCGDCAKEVTRVEITNANTASHIGAFKDVNVYQKDPVIAYQAVTCDGIFYKDCDGNDMAAPACCPKPASSCSKDDSLSEVIVDCTFCCTGIINTGRNGINNPGSTDFSAGPATGATYQELVEALQASGYETVLSEIVNDEGQTIQDIQNITICGPEAVEGFTFTPANGTPVTVALECESQKALQTIVKDSYQLADVKVECASSEAGDSALIGHCGRPNNTVSYEYGGISGATLEEFTANWRAAGYCTWIADFDGIGGGECHWYAPAFPGTDFLVDGVVSDSQGDVVVPNPNPAVCDIQTQTAILTVGCADDRRDAKLDQVIDKLCELVDLLGTPCGEEDGGGDDEKCELVDGGTDPGNSFGYSVANGGTVMKSGPIAQSTVTSINNAIAAGYEVVIRLEGGGVVFAATAITNNVFTGGFSIEGQPATCVTGSDGDGTSADFVYEIYVP